MENNNKNELIDYIINDFNSGIKHGVLVANLTFALAKEYGLSDDEAYELKIAAMVHDIGKLKLSKYLYGRSNENLLEEEKKYMSMHSKISYDVLKKYDYSDNIMKVVLSHHECYDGSGYPGGFVGEDIPVGARILKVADEFAALISDRPYRKAFDIDTAVSIMIDEVKNLDMKVFILFQRLIHEEKTLELINNSRLDIDDLDISDILGIDFQDNQI